MSQKQIVKLVKAIESMPKKGKPSRKQRKNRASGSKALVAVPRAPSRQYTIADYLSGDRRIGLQDISVATSLSAKSVSDGVYTTRFTRTFAAGVLGEIILINPSLIFLDVIHGDLLTAQPTFQPYSLSPLLIQPFTSVSADPFNIATIQQGTLNNQFTTYTGDTSTTTSSNGTGYFLGVAGEISVMEDSSVFNEGGRLTFVDGSQGAGLLSWRYTDVEDGDTGAHHMPTVTQLAQPQLSYQVPLTRSKKHFRFGMSLPHQVEFRDIPELVATSNFSTAKAWVATQVDRNVWPDDPLDFADMGYTVALVVQPSNTEQTVTYEISFRSLTHYFPPSTSTGVTSNVLARPDNTIVPVNHALAERNSNGNAQISIAQQSGNPVQIASGAFRKGLNTGIQHATAGFSGLIERGLESAGEALAGKAGRAVAHYADKAIMRIPEALGSGALRLIKYL